MYYVFDLLRLGDKDLRTEPLYRRKSLLQKLLRKNDTLRYVDHIERDGLSMTFHSVHRPLQAYVDAMSTVGLSIERVLEVADLGSPAEDRWRRMPLFLDLRAVKSA